MSYYHVPAPPRRHLARKTIAAIAGVCVLAALTAGWSAARPISVTVDGQHVRVMAGTTVGTLAEREVFSAGAGDLLGVTGSVVETAGGMPARVERNGQHAAVWQRVYDGDVLVSARGSDRTESLIVTETPIPFESRFEGSGPIVEVKQLGAPGRKRLMVGELSGIEVTSTVAAEPVDAVFVRTRPKPGAKIVALTFDDGPRRGQTDRILDILKERQVPATFFVVGTCVKAQPSLARRIVREGHQIANHSLSHPRLTAVDAKTVRREVLQGRNAIRDKAGVRTTWFRPPYGALDRAVWDELKRIDQHVVLWDVDPQDWSRPGTKRIVDNVVANVRPGSIVLLHDGGADRRQTIAALPVIITRLKAKGYVFVTVQDLAAAK